MRDWVDWVNGEEAQRYEPIMRAAIAHHGFEAVHPFEDGNGRCGRLLLNLMLMRDGYPPALLLRDWRDGYLIALDAANTAMADLGKCRRQPKDFKKDMELMKGNYDGLAAQVGGIEAAIASEDYLGAKAQADSLKSSADTLVTDLQGAKVKIKC